MKPLQVSRLLSPITALGPGRRVGLWVQGCALACSGCASLDTWDPDGGYAATTDEVAQQIIDLLNADSTLTGLTVTGGEPSDQATALTEVIRSVREWESTHARALDVLIFTGRSLAAARSRGPQVFDMVDAVVAGRYDRSSGPGRGLIATSNQELHLLTEVGRRRYPAYQECEQTIQVTVDGDQLSLVGLPRPGDLDRLRRSLAGHGIAFEKVSWRT